MSDTDSFIDEVTEEVRRDRLFAQLRRFAPLAIGAVVLIVGGAAYKEYRKAREIAVAQANGDAIYAALSQTDAAARRDALGNAALTGSSVEVLRGMLRASEEQAAGNDSAAVATWMALANDPATPAVYARIAQYKALITAPEAEMSNDEKRAGFEALVGDGGGLRTLAEEQIALLDIADGRTDAALERLSQLAVDADASRGLKERAIQLIAALGGTPPAIANPAEGQQ